MKYIPVMIFTHTIRTKTAKYAQKRANTHTNLGYAQKYAQNTHKCTEIMRIYA